MSHSPNRFRRDTVVAVLAAVASALILLSGCSAGSPASGDSGGEGSPDAAGSGAGSTVAGGTATGAPEAARDGIVGFGSEGRGAGAPATGVKAASGTAALPPKLAKTANLDLRVRDLATAAASVRRVAITQQGFVVQEAIGSGGQSDPAIQPSEPFDGRATMTLSVPAASLDTTLTQLSRIGTVLSRGTSSADVTSQYVDTESRVKTMRASVERVRSLMSRAKDIGQVVTLEGELSRRQSDLESLESQLEQLKGQVERSTVQVSLSTPTRLSATGSNGFLDGLAAGWDAFTRSARGLLTAVGAVLPFAAFLALLATPVVIWLRRHPRRRTASPLAASLTGSPAPDAPAVP